MKKITTIFICLSSLACLPLVLYAAEEKGMVDAVIDTAAKIVKAPLAGASDIAAKAGKKVTDQTRSAKKEFTKKEMLEHALVTLEHEEEVLSYIPELRKEKGSDGKILYRYKGTRLEDLDEKKTMEVFRRINNEAARIRAERLNKQLENIRRTQQAVSSAQQAAQQRIVTPPPVVRPPYTPPSVPKPPQIPQIPKPPPQPPTRQR